MTFGPAEDTPVGMNAEVIAIGPYSEAVADHLAHPREYYAETRLGTTVLVKVFEGVTSELSCKLASCFGASAWDFNTHELDPTKADLEALSSEFDGVANFIALRAAGFRFFYMPNG
jgi:hypothetical protein